MKETTVSERPDGYSIKEIPLKTVAKSMENVDIKAQIKSAKLDL